MRPDRPPAAVFVSYSSRDLAMARELDAALRSAGIGTWFAPRDVAGGRSIVAAIREATVLVVLFTSSANASPHVHRELALASDFNLRILPIRIDRVAYLLKLVQWVSEHPARPRRRARPRPAAPACAVAGGTAGGGPRASLFNSTTTTWRASRSRSDGLQRT